MRDLHDEFVRLEIPVGGKFVLVPGDGSFKLKEHDEDAPGGARRSDPDTSQRAKLDAMPRTGTHRHRALLAIVQAGSRGMTYAEVEDAIGVTGIWKRLTELREGGWVLIDGERRVQRTGSDAQVYKATEKGRREVVASVGYREETLV